MKTFAIALILSFFVACGISQDPHVADTTQNVTTAPDWFVGEWLCKTGYFNVKAANTTIHDGLAVYTVVPVLGEPGVFRGEFAEYFTSDGSTPRSWSDRWVINDDATTSKDNVVTNTAGINMVFSDGNIVDQGTGTTRSLDPSTTIFGAVSFDGLIAPLGQPPLTWHRTIFVDAPEPRKFSETMRIQIAGPGTQQQYFQSVCTLDGL